MDVTSGEVVGSYYYDAFGNIIEQTGNANNSITYAGYQYDAESGLYYLNARHYDPKTARFMQEDTYRGEPNDPLSLNLYTYCANNPLTYYDPTGHSWEGIKNWFSDTKESIKRSVRKHSNDVFGKLFYRSIGDNEISEQLTVEHSEGFTEASAETYQYAEDTTAALILRDKEKATELSIAIELYGAKTGLDAPLDVIDGGILIANWENKPGDYLEGGLILGSLLPFVGLARKIGKTLDATSDTVKTFDKIEDTTDAITDGTRKYRGGKHGDTKNPIGDGLDSHHTPAKQASPLEPDDGPAIQMEPADHRRTASYGGSQGSPQQAYRDKQKDLIDQGKFDDAFLMDVDDVQSKFGNKYDEAILEAIDELPKLK